MVQLNQIQPDPTKSNETNSANTLVQVPHSCDNSRWTDGGGGSMKAFLENRKNIVMTAKNITIF